MLVKIISIMLRNTYTTDDLVQRLEFMRVYYGKRLFAGGTELTLVDVLQDTVEPHTLGVLTAWLKAFDDAQISPIVVYEALDTVEEEIQGVPSVMVYTPIRFSHEHVERFGVWFRKNVQPNMLMTLRVDPRAGGGCGLIWKDTYYDFSLRYHIHTHREEVVKMFDSYTKAHA